MKAAERVERAIKFQRPDRVPFIGYNGLSPLRSDIFPIAPLTPKSWQPAGSRYYPHVNELQWKFRQYKWKPKQWDPAPPKTRNAWKHQPHEEIDEWGVIWELLGDGTMGWPVEGPSKIWDQLNDLMIPDGGNPQRYALTGRLNRLLPKRSKFRMGYMDNFLFERTHFLRGWNNYMRDIIRSPNKIQELIHKILPYYESAIQKLFEYGAKGVFTTDDWGSQQDVLISPGKFVEIFLEPYKYITKLCHDLGMVFVLHSCGNVGRFIPLFIDAGIDALEFDSPRMTGLEAMHQYEGKMCFICIVNIQTVYPHGTKDDVIKEVLAMMDAVGDKDGGFIAMDYEGAHSVLNVPQKNLKTFEWAVKKFGHYLPDGTLDKSNWPRS